MPAVAGIFLFEPDRLGISLTSRANPLRRMTVEQQSAGPSEMHASESGPRKCPTSKYETL